MDLLIYLFCLKGLEDDNYASTSLLGYIGIRGGEAKENFGD